MRISFMLSVAMATLYFAICNATGDFNPITLSAMGSPELVHTLDEVRSDAGTPKRYLRVHGKDGETGAEERGLGELMAKIKYMVENADLRSLLKAILDEILKADDGYRTWVALRYNAHGAGELLNLWSPRRD
ncbi:secreted RxLR effector peptide protein, putative [Phytophthora infestans T30-4]|uniref:RxLR effector protein n=2 Tax=Phytophthora infestans TaxID=4787 RepID=D0NDU6_PHYIT|nr:secreted RxLR effector peptide protein, putative [Phytophthora infestans T30-4]EEY56391.1 secreted RxLR effector peptide protein, putative [Phytophthora infestans T30-4]KAF4030556.1 RXLR domain-containing protein [Phytophthora infestans]KAF4040886.1 RXLR domain-containing protein [Phytophthora infestans]|eukprot:XP_002902465.1 secreted RxLR effector peptide protein, putative [Phytophthora infestans T30-4]